MARWIDLNEVFHALMQASITNGYVAKDGVKVAKRTIESGFEKGMESPRPPLMPAHIEAIDIAPIAVSARDH